MKTFKELSFYDNKSATLRFSDGELDSQKIQEYSKLRDEELENRNKYYYENYLDEKDEFLSGNQNDKKIKEFFQFLELPYRREFDYKIIDFSLELFDAVVQINNKIIGIEITQATHRKSAQKLFKEAELTFYKLKQKNRIKRKEFLLEIKIDELLYQSDGNKFRKQFEAELLNLIDGVPFEAEPSRKFIEKFKFIPNDSIDMCLNNSPRNSMYLDNEFIQRTVNKKEEKLSIKLGNLHLSVDEKWLLLFSSGMPYDDYHKVDEEFMREIKLNFYDRIIFLNKKREFLYDFLFEETS